MNTLETCYELDFSKVEFQERKQRITHPKTLLYGPSKAGKSYLIFDYLSNFKTQDYIYIDMNDMRNRLEEIQLTLQEFIGSHGIEVVVLENFNFEFPLPNCDSIIITTKSADVPYGFKQMRLMPLDFEEFLLHDHKQQNATHAFNSFLKYGNLPGIINFEEHKKISRSQEIIKLYANNPLKEEVLKLLFESSDEKKSLHQLFTQLKKTHKISKDKFYEYCKNFENDNAIFFIPKFNQPKAVKKIYSYNHAFLTTVSHNKKFKNEFANLVFLELYNQYKTIYYLDNIDFYIPKEKMIILVLPFFNALLANSIKKRISNAIEELNVSDIFIITVGNSDTLTINNKKIPILPFYEWALLN